MGCELAIGATYYREFNLVYPNGDFIGQPVNADSLPTVELRQNGSIIVVDIPTITVTNDSLGHYDVSFEVPANWNNGDSIEVYVNLDISAVAYRHSIGGFTVIVIPSDILVNPATPVVSREAIETIYGISNIIKWADADDDGDATKISNRISWAANRARMYVEGKLAKRFTVPFNPYPELVVELICERAGFELYRSPRGLANGADEAEVIQQHATEVETRLQQILAGTLVLVDAINDCTSVPKSISNQPLIINPLNDFNQIYNSYPFLFPDSLYYMT